MTHVLSLPHLCAVQREARLSSWPPLIAPGLAHVLGAHLALLKILLVLPVPSLFPNPFLWCSPLFSHVQNPEWGPSPYRQCSSMHQAHSWAPVTLASWLSPG